MPRFQYVTDYSLHTLINNKLLRVVDESRDTGNIGHTRHNTIQKDKKMKKDEPNIAIMFFMVLDIMNVEQENKGKEHICCFLRSHEYHFKNIIAMFGSSFFIFLSFCIVLCLVCPMLPVSLDYPFWIVPSGFFNV
jgi:hypothetical protein